MEDLSRYHTLLRDPTRRKIIEILGEHGKIGFKELRQSLGLGVGTVYYHLDMLSDFITQDKNRKYMLNDRGRLLLRSPPALEIKEAFSSKLGKWLFLTRVFTKTAQPEKLLPISFFILVLGGVGSAWAELDPLLFFYFKSSGRQFENVIGMFLFDWIGLFLFSDALIYLLYKRVGGDLQLFTCLGRLSNLDYITSVLSLLLWKGFKT